MNRAFLLIILGAGLWGTIGWYVKHLYSFGFTPMEVVFLRAITSALLLFIYLLITSPKSLKLLQPTDIKYFLGTGILSIIFFNYCLFTTIELSTLPVATALLYTAPAFVTIISYFLFKEAFTKLKVVSLIFALIGTCLVVGIVPLNLKVLQMGTIVFGLGSAIGYALYSIFSKFALEKYSSLTITTYTFIIAAVALLPFFPYQEKIKLFLQPNVFLFSFGLGFLPTAFAYIIYTYGLNQTEASKASILTTIEPVVASIIGIFIFNETFTFIQMIGMAIIIGSVLLIQVYPNLEKDISSDKQQISDVNHRNANRN